MTGLLTSPATALGSAPSMPATTMSTLHASRRSRSPSRRWMPATPTSVMRTTPLPKISSVTAASSATGRSEVPAQMMPTTPSHFGSGSVSTVMHRARSCQRAAGNSAASARCCSSFDRLTSSTRSFAKISRPIASTSAAVLPAPKMTSGKPQRRARSLSTRAKPRSVKPSGI